LKVLKTTPAFRGGAWSQIEPQPAWPGNASSGGFAAYAWAGEDSDRRGVVVNYTGSQAQCRLKLTSNAPM